MAARVVIEYRGERPPSLNGPKGLKRMHHREYTKTRDRWQMLLRAKYGASVEIPTPCRLFLTVYSSRAIDIDNAACVAKVPLDVMQRLGWLKDDGEECIVSMEVLRERCPRKDVGFRAEFVAA